MANRKIGQAGLALIKQFEGCRLAAYQCSAVRGRSGTVTQQAYIKE